jgi:CelD/BcsL family acetyltransferase involved in cellulose biosynthesis
VANAETERLEIVTTIERLEEVSDAWSDLWRDAGALIFQSHDWIAGWWRGASDSGRTLQIVLGWRGERLEAVLPLVRSRMRGIGMLEWAAREFSDYCDAIVRPDGDPAILRRMWELLWSDGDFDAAYLSRLLPGAAATRSLLGQAESRAASLRPYYRSEQSLRVAGSWPEGQAWFDQQTKKARQNYRRGVKAMSKNATFGFRLLSPDEPFVPVLNRLAELKRHWLERNGLEAPLFDQDSLRLATFAQVLAANGLLRIFVLERDGVIVAISLNFMQSSSMMAYLTAYDPAYERASPGMVLMVDYIKWSIDHGLTVVDFLCGAEEFKGRFATQTVTLASFVAARTWLGRMALIADRVMHRLKGWRRLSRAAMRRFWPLRAPVTAGA